MRVEVSQEDIDNGVPGRPYSCAVALAVRRADGGWVSFVGSSEVRLRDHAWCSLPEHVQQFIIDFDHGRRVEPFAFDLKCKETSDA